MVKPENALLYSYLHNNEEYKRRESRNIIMGRPIADPIRFHPLDSPTKTDYNKITL